MIHVVNSRGKVMTFYDVRPFAKMVAISHLITYFKRVI